MGKFQKWVKQLNLAKLKIYVWWKFRKRAKNKNQASQIFLLSEF